jgi:hypothetical protein
MLTCKIYLPGQKSFWDVPSQPVQSQVQNCVVSQVGVNPGRCASVTLFGNSDNQRSGFHSSASDPQIAGLRFEARMETMTSVRTGTGISVAVDPSRVVIGVETVNATSFCVLGHGWEQGEHLACRIVLCSHSSNERYQRVPMAGRYQQARLAQNS